MNGETNEMERTSTDLALFGAAFFGFVIGAAGLVLSCILVAVTGLAVLGFALGGFLLKQLADD
jgi:hypothetical protein